MDLVIFTDGASRSNPGHAAIGYRITDGKSELETGGEYIGVKTNNEAEYQALITALKKARKYSDKKVKIFQILIYNRCVKNPAEGGYTRRIAVGLVRKNLCSNIGHLVNH